MKCFERPSLSHGLLFLGWYVALAPLPFYRLVVGGGGCFRNSSARVRGERRTAAAVRERMPASLEAQQRCPCIGVHLVLHHALLFPAQQQAETK